MLSSQRGSLDGSVCTVSYIVVVQVRYTGECTPIKLITGQWPHDQTPTYFTGLFFCLCLFTTQTIQQATNPLRHSQ